MRKRVKEVTISKDQIAGLRSYRRSTVITLGVIICLSLWMKISLNPGGWHLNDVLVEVISLFVLILMAILANIKNDFPIFQFRKLKITKDIAYSIVLFFGVLFLFIIYKNIIDPSFIDYLAVLSFHDLTTIIVFLLPVFAFITVLLYFGIGIFDKNKNKNEKLPVYKESIENSLDQYKSITIRIIFTVTYLSIWIKVGFLTNNFIPNVTFELCAIFTIIVMSIIGNIDNKLRALYSRYIYIDRFFICSILLPYILILLYTVFSKDFRQILILAGFSGIISVLVSMTPLFFLASLLFYKGLRVTNKGEKKSKVIKNAFSKNKIRQNALISLLASLAIIALLFYYSFATIIDNYNIEIILQMIIVFIPLGVIIYLIIYSCMSEINK